jgi:hypothetical protein
MFTKFIQADNNGLLCIDAFLVSSIPKLRMPSVAKRAFGWSNGRDWA